MSRPGRAGAAGRSSRGARPSPAGRVAEAVSAIRRAGPGRIAPRVGVILGSGLGGLVTAVSAAAAVPYAEIPHMPVPTAAGHAGELVLGRLEDRPVALLRGRCHLYEGYSPQEVTFPVRVLAGLGVRVLIVTNAAGGLNPVFRTGDLMVITDHINFTGTNPLAGPNDDALGPRFPDLRDAYDPALRAAAGAAARAENVPLREGVYAGVLGPSYETPAEIAMLRAWGADAVGMSTVAEVIVARHAGLRVLGISAITNAGPTAWAPPFRGTGRTSAGAPGGTIAPGGEPLTHDAVLAAARALEPRLVRLVRRIVGDLGAV